MFYLLICFYQMPIVEPQLSTPILQKEQLSMLLLDMSVFTVPYLSNGSLYSVSSWADLTAAIALPYFYSYYVYSGVGWNNIWTFFFLKLNIHAFQKIIFQFFQCCCIVILITILKDLVRSVPISSLWWRQFGSYFFLRRHLVNIMFTMVYLCLYSCDCDNYIKT